MSLMSDIMKISGMFTILTLLMLMVSTYVEGARILCVTHQFKSHQMMVHSVAEGLIPRGHEVYTLFSDKMTVPDGLEESGFKILRFRTPEGRTQLTVGRKSVDLIDDILKQGHQYVARKTFSALALNECMDIDNDTKLHKQLTDLHFDLVIADVYPLTYCMSFIALKLQLPFVLVPAFIEMETTRTFNFPSVLPTYFTLFTDEMTFTERIINSYTSLGGNWGTFSGFPSILDLSLLHKYNINPQVQTWHGHVRNAQLSFISRGLILEYPYFLTPNTINVECLTCKPGKPLTKAIQDMIGNSKINIVVSFGSVVDELPELIAAKFIEAFSQRKELILWRYNGQLPGKVPPNLKVMNWLPQNDLLADPRTKLFITHSGNNGQYESVYHGVPMLAFPIFAEQPFNAVRMVKHGYGLKIDIKSFTANELGAKMAEILANSSYRDKTQTMSRVLKSRPMDARQTAVYWIEHVLKFGADHLRTHALDMPWYSVYMLDIILSFHIVVLALICVTGGLFYLLFTLIYRGMSKQKQH